MRIKVECAPPLPAVKAWFVVPAVSSILELKTSLISQFPALQNLSPTDLSFSLDGFELLDLSPIDVVRDGELVSVRHLITNIHKRKGRKSTLSPPAKRPKFTPSLDANEAHVPTKPVPQASPAKSLSESDSEELTDSESDSDSEESSTSSDSDNSSDESSSSSSSAPPVRTSKAALKASGKPVNVPIVHVPPGHGKVATQSRNMRRRRKRMAERLASQIETSNVNETPLGQRKAAETIVPEAQSVTPTIMMASLSNKNKRKGFKQAMSSVLPKKILFEESSPVTTSELPFASMPSAEVTAAAPNLFSRLVPPSERQANGQIPRNVFVTSIDVEEDLYTQKKAKRRAGVAEAEVETVVLNYGEAEDVISAQIEHATGREVDWPGVEQRWESLAKVVGSDQVSKGAILGWKALGINPATFTPEVMLNLGRAIAVGDQLTIKPVLRPGVVSLSFGALEDEEDVEPEEEVFVWDDVRTGDWRIVEMA